MKIGAQIYSLRSLINNASDLEKVFEFLQNSGAESVEMIDFSFADSKFLKELSGKYNIEIGSTHTDYNRLFSQTEKVIEEHLEFGCSIAGIGCMPLNKYNITRLDGIMKFCEDINRIASVAEKFGATIDYHNHAFEFKKLGGERIIDIIIANTAPNVKLCFDMYWAKVAGSSVEEYLGKCADKINVLHFKDYKKKFIGSKYVTVGEGILDMSNIYQLAKSNNIKFGYVEHDNPKDPSKTISDGIKFLNRLK